MYHMCTFVFVSIFLILCTLLSTFSTFYVGDMCALCLWPTYLCIYAFKSVGNQSILHLLETPYQISTVNCLISIYENGRQTDCLAKLELKWKSTFFGPSNICVNTLLWWVCTVCRYKKPSQSWFIGRCKQFVSDNEHSSHQQF